MNVEQADEQLRRNVLDALSWDPRVDAGRIDVEAHRDAITLRGTVGSVRERTEALRTARHVRGVTSVDDQLDVGIGTGQQRDDADVRGDVLRGLSLNLMVPDSITAAVDHGVVTLTGSAKYHYQREEAEVAAGNIHGVVGVHDEVTITSAPLADNQDSPTDDADLANAILLALHRDARLRAEGVTVTAAHGTVTLSGVAHSWPAHDAAVAAVWNAPGVRNVRDDLTIGPAPS
jgi:osmotically-inducible protein OsmY